MTKYHKQILQKNYNLSKLKSSHYISFNAEISKPTQDPCLIYLKDTNQHTKKDTRYTSYRAQSNYNENTNTL
jgi:hypothetical protein